MQIFVWIHLLVIAALSWTIDSVYKLPREYTWVLAVSYITSHILTAIQYGIFYQGKN